jgi:hypothetical protein
MNECKKCINSEKGIGLKGSPCASGFEGDKCRGFKIKPAAQKAEKKG